MDYKNATAAKTTETLDPNTLDVNTGNIYEAVALIGKRSEQINDTIREELHAKLAEFASHTENLEEIFENKEQIEISKFYENLPKPNALATEEWIADEIYVRRPEKS
jgi:DNA-directed RNA polymerase subunit K/omega